METATLSLQDILTRVVHMRFEIILNASGGALKKMALPFHLGLGGKIDTGKQIMSWIDLNEIPPIVDFLIKNKQMTGAVNVVSPNSVSNQELTDILGEVLKKPTIFKGPSPFQCC